MGNLREFTRRILPVPVGMGKSRMSLLRKVMRSIMLISVYGYA